MTLSICSRPRMSSWAAAGVRARCSRRASVLYRISLTSELLPEPLTPVTAMNAPSGKATSMFLRLFWRAPLTTSKAPRASAATLRADSRLCDRLRPHAAMRRFVGTGIAFLPDRYCPVSDAFARSTCFGVPARGDLAAAVAGAGAEVEQVVGRRDHLAVVLDQDQRVAEVAQVLQRLQQPAIVARVQADGRLVQHVQHAGQAAADLAGQADALRFAAGQRRRRPAQRQVIEADVDQELQPVARSRAAARRPPAAAAASASAPGTAPARRPAAGRTARRASARAGRRRTGSGRPRRRRAAASRRRRSRGPR